MKALKSFLSKILFVFARSRIGAVVIGWSFAHMTSFMPVDKLYESQQLMAFHHPRPIYPVHILIVPKRTIRSLMAIVKEDISVIEEVFLVVQKLVQQLKLEEPGFRLMVNGGSYQDVMQIHFHLISGDEKR
jgi:histidine triad (HIT) family protein